MSDFIFDELNAEFEAMDDVQVYSQSGGTLPAGDFNVEVIKSRLSEDDDRTQLSFQVKAVGGDYDGASKWINFTLKGGKHSWMRERDVKFLKQIMLAAGMDQPKSADDYIGALFGLRLEERNGYTNLKRIFKDVPKPTTKDQVTTPAATSETPANPFF